MSIVDGFFHKQSTINNKHFSCPLTYELLHNHSLPMSSIIFLDVDPEDRASVTERFPDAIFCPAHESEKELVDSCKDAEVVSTFITTAFPHSVIEQLPKLKLLCTRSVGYDHIDLEACEEKGIVVTNVPDYGSHVIAEHVFALLLSTIRHIEEGNRRVEEGTFDYHGLRGMALQGKTIGIVGTGKIGRKVARIAHGFGMKILAVDVCRVLELEEQYGVRYVELPELLGASDILSLHVPSLPETNHMINAKTIAQMKDGAILVNTARGSLVDTDALLDALDSGKMRLALLDVLENEANMTEDARLVHHPKVVTTPHIAFYADDSMRNMYNDCFTSIDEWKKGDKPVHIVQSVHVVCDVPGVTKQKK